MQNVNTVVVTGNLTRDPELRSIPSGNSICSLRLAVNGRRKDASGEWVDDPNYFDVTVFGRQGENCAQYLAKGRGVAVEGRLDWREWETAEGAKRSAVQIVANNVQFLSDGQRRPQGDEVEWPIDEPPVASVPAASAPPGDDDIPFAYDDPFTRAYRETRYNPFV